jgi:hypothetical protein
MCHATDLCIYKPCLHKHPDNIGPTLFHRSTISVMQVTGAILWQYYLSSSVLVAICKTWSDETSGSSPLLGSGFCVPFVEDPEKKLQNLQQRKWVYFAGQMKRHRSTVLSSLSFIKCCLEWRCWGLCRSIIYIQPSTFNPMLVHNIPGLIPCNLTWRCAQSWCPPSTSWLQAAMGLTEKPLQLKLNLQPSRSSSYQYSCLKISCTMSVRMWNYHMS